MTFQCRQPTVPLRILLVEDSETVRVLTAEYLRSRGFDVVDVESAEEAIAALDVHRFDVLFTDVSLPGMSGADLVKSSRLAHPGLGFVISSGFDHHPAIDGAPPVEFLAKPYDFGALDRAIERAATEPS